MSNKANIQQNILNAVDTIVTQRINALELDKTIVATIVSSMGVREGRNVYRVEYSGGYFNATCQSNSDYYLPRMAVYVSIPQNDFSKEKIIIGRASTLTTKKETTVVSSAASNYGVIGKNVINPIEEDISAGVYSYHSTDEEQDHPETIKHKYNFIYQYAEDDNIFSVDADSLSTYMQEASALMIKADFRAILSDEQRKKTSGRYGLAFNFIFKNLNAQYGETQGEVFDTLAPTVVVDEDNLALHDEIIYQAITTTSEDDINNITAADLGLLDIQINTILELVRVFEENNAAAYTDILKNLIQAYIYLLQDMQVCTSINDMISRYEEWRNTETGEPAEKNVSYFLDSNMMVGNPYYFSSWIEQYAIFDMDLTNFIRLDSVLLFKEGFIEDSTNESLWPLAAPGTPDIFVKNVQLYTLKPLDSLNGAYQLKVEATDTGAILETFDSEEEVKFRAILNRQVYEDLSNNTDTTFYWFKQDKTVISNAHAKYLVYGGIGWAKIDNFSKAFIANGDENRAYENHYRCAAVYTGEENPIVLRYDFIVYNNAAKDSVVSLESSLGTAFSFDAGNPMITCKIGADNPQEIWTDDEGHKYRYYWSITDSNQQKVFLQKELTELNLSNITSVDEVNLYINTKALLNGIEFYKGDEKAEDITEATRIKYPMSNVALDENITFECYVDKERDTDSYYDFGTAKLTLANQGVNSTSDYRIYIENGEQVFQYDEYGNSPTAGKYKDPQEILPVRAHLLAPNGLEILSSNFRTYWYFNLTDSMIIPTSDTTLELNPVTGETNMLVSTDCAFAIADIYNPNAITNQLTCKVIFGDKELYQDTNFYFGKAGSNGTNGTDMVAKVQPSSTAAILREQPLTMYVNKGFDTENASAFFNTQISSNRTNEDGSLQITGTTGALVAKLYQRSLEVTPEKTKWNLAGNKKATLNNTGCNFKLTEGNLIWQRDFNINTDEDKSKYYTLQNIRAELTYEDKKYYAFYSLPIIKYTDTVPILSKNRIAINDKTYLKEIVYNADGRNPVFNQNQGIELINLPDNCSVSWVAKGKLEEGESTPAFKFLTSKDAKKKDAVITVDNQGEMLYILPDDEFSGADTNNHIEATITVDDSVIAIAYIPINMTLNTYGLASLNAWDGNSVDINEDGEYIMAPQIGAGVKDETTNMFTGVLMGKAETYGMQNGEPILEQQTGLFGYSHGIQSIFLDAATGNASFGLPDGTLYDEDSNTIIRNYSGDLDYDEGRIELKPGGESIIGGWRLGRRSLYYVVDDDEDNTPQNISSKYDGTNHQRDIGHEHKGILLNAAPEPYISIKGRALTVGVGSDYDIDNTTGNAALETGDSFELNLDPNQKDFFTLYRHHQESEDKWLREPLVGIDGMGRFYTNSLKDKETSLTMNYVSGFGVSSNGEIYGTKPTEKTSERYAGLFVGYGDTTLFKSFIQVAAPEGETIDNTLHISSGIWGNEYQRPISLHGKTISLYASNSSSTEKTTKTSLQLTDNLVSIYANNAHFKLSNLSTTSTDLTSIGPITINAGTNNSRTSLNINANNQYSTIANTTNITTGSYQLTAKTGDIQISTSNLKQILIHKGDNTLLSLSRNGGSDEAILQVNATNVFKLSNTASGLLDVDNGFVIDSENVVKIEAVQTNSQLIGSTVDSSAIVLQAVGKDSNRKSTLMLNPRISNSSLTSYPMYCDFESAGNLHVKTKIDDSSSLLRSCFYMGMNAEINDGLSINGVYYGSGDIGLFLSHGIKASHITINNDAYSYKFNNTRIEDAVQGVTDHYYAQGTTLAKLIQDCLTSARQAKQSADAAQTAADAAQTTADSVATSLSNSVETINRSINNLSSALDDKADTKYVQDNYAPKDHKHGYYQTESSASGTVDGKPVTVQIYGHIENTVDPV